MSSIVEAARPEVLKWYRSKALQNASAALDLLSECEEAESWLPGASRKILAALSKTNVAEKIGRQVGPMLRNLGGTKQNYGLGHGYAIEKMLTYGMWRPTTTIDFDLVRSQATSEEIREAVDLAEQYQADFAPLNELCDVLDATRPPPTVTYVGASPTVTRTLEHVGVVGRLDTVRICPIRWVKVERRGPDGRLEIVRIGVLEWPPGTIHDSSIHASGSALAGNPLCHACGHAIKNPHNWLPLLIDDADGRPRSLWVGRDCGETLFGFKIRGVLEIKLD